MLRWCVSILDDIRDKVRARQYLFSKHATDQSIVRGIGPTDVEEAILVSSEVIEDYPMDKYGPSYLIFGYTKAGRPLHLQCAYSESTVLKIVTLYEPDPTRWIGLRIRKVE